MDYNQLIEGFIESELSIDEENSLFEAMTDDPELRKELHASIMIERGMGKRMVALAPTSSETAGVFSALGFAPAGLASAGSGGATIATSTGLNSIWASVITICMGFAAFVGLLDAPHLFDGQEPSEITQHNDNTSRPEFNIDLSVPPSIISTVSQDKSSKPKPKSSSLLPINNIIASNTADRSQAQNSYDGPSNNSNVLSTTASITPSMLKYKNSILTAESNKAKDDIFSSELSNLNSSSYPAEYESLTKIDFHNKNLQTMRVELRNLSTLSTPPDDFNISDNPTISDMGLSFFYPFFEDIELGLTYDRKMYYLEYESTTADGLFDFRQYTLYSSLQLSGQWLPLGNANKINPFLRLGIGGSSVGPVASSVVGAYIPIIGGMEIMAGYDIQGLGFIIDNNFYTGINHGLTIGLSVDL